MNDDRPLVARKAYRFAIIAGAALLFGLASLLVSAQTWQSLATMAGLGEMNTFSSFDRTGRIVGFTGLGLVGAVVGWFVSRWLPSSDARDSFVSIEGNEAEVERWANSPEPDFDRVGEPVDFAEEADELLAGLPAIGRDESGTDRGDDWFEEQDSSLDEPLPDHGNLSGEAGMRIRQSSLTKKGSEELSDLSLSQLVDRFETVIRSSPSRPDRDSLGKEIPARLQQDDDQAQVSADPGRALRDALRRLEESRSNNG